MPGRANTHVDHLPSAKSGSIQRWIQLLGKREGANIRLLKTLMPPKNQDSRLTNFVHGRAAA